MATTLTITVAQAAATPLPPSPEPEPTIAEQVALTQHAYSCLAEWRMVLTGLTVRQVHDAWQFACRRSCPGADGDLLVALARYCDEHGGALYSTNPQNLGHRLTVAELQADCDDE